MQNSINTAVVERSQFRNKNLFEDCIIEIVKKHRIDYIFLAGYKYIIEEEFIQVFPNRIVNIHPSLLPVFKGVKAIDQAIDYGVKITGITTHFVNKELDGGKIIMQKAINIEEGETFLDIDNKIFKAGTVITVKTINDIFI